ncbi:MAG: hypothetical protein WBH03_19325, partial [Cyclobacteriaceae bacterium]
MKTLCKQLYLICFFITTVSVTSFAQDHTILRVENVRSGWNKLKIGNNPASFWTPKVNVTATGNTALTLEFRIPEGTPDMNRVQIRPNGYSGNPVSLAAYLPGGFAFGYDWYTISIPLADFDAAIDFTALNLLQLPYSNNTTPFVMEIRSVSFTGGITPYVWFGDGKRDNIHDGQGVGSQMTAALEKEYFFDIIYDYPGRKNISNISGPIYNRTDECQAVVATCMQDGESRIVAILGTPVTNCKTVAGNYAVQAQLKNTALVTENYTIPNLGPVQATNTVITPPDGVNDGTLETTLINGASSYFLNDNYNGTILLADSVETYIWAKNISDEDIGDIDTDLMGNIYTIQGEALMKYDTDGILLWSMPFGSLVSKAEAIYSDPAGNVYLGLYAGADFFIGDRYLGNDGNASVVIRVSPEGNVDWMRKFNTGRIQDITGDGRGSIYIIGGVHMIRIGVDGNFKWQKTGTAGGTYWGSITSDRQGNVYGGLTMYEGSSFDGIPVNNTPENNGWANGADAGGVVFKIDSSGTIPWLQVLDYSHTIRSMSADNN